MRKRKRNGFKYIQMIIFLGLPKCGTMSFTQSFNAAGFRAVHWVNDAGEYVGELMLRALREGKKMFHYLSEYNVLTQMDVCLPDKNICLFPQSDLYELIYRQYPKASFILNHRTTENHVKSIYSWGGLRERLRLFGITDLTSFVEQHNKNIRDFFCGKPNFIEFSIESDGNEKISQFVGIHIELVHINKTP